MVILWGQVAVTEVGANIRDANLVDRFTNPIYVFGLVKAAWFDVAGRQSSRIRRGTRLCLL
jgi:hypothetical protein